MKKRLRKKLRLREFQQMGFSVDLKINLPNQEDRDDWWFRFLDFLIANGLECGGGYITRPGRGSVTEADRETVANWLQQHPEATEVKVWPLDDAWHGPFLWL